MSEKSWLLEKMIEKNFQYVNPFFTVFKIDVQNSKN